MTDLLWTLTAPTGLVWTPAEAARIAEAAQQLAAALPGRQPWMINLDGLVVTDPNWPDRPAESPDATQPIRLDTPTNRPWVVSTPPGAPALTADQQAALRRLLPGGAGVFIVPSDAYGGAWSATP